MVEIGRIMAPGQLGEKVNKTPSQPIKAGCGGTHLSVIPAMQEA
jgi:hypothetical protein